MDIDALFNQDQTPAETPVVEVPAETPAPGPEAQPAPETAPEPAPEIAPETKEAKSVPLATFLDIRDELKEAKRRAADLEAQYAPRPVSHEMPDPIDDPQGFAAWNQGQTQQALDNQRFTMSDLMARQQYGEETVKVAADWATERGSTDAVFKAAYMQQPHPLDWIVREHKRADMLSAIGDNPDDYFSQEAAKRGWTPPAPNTAPAFAAAATPTAAKPAVPPRSIASDAPAPKVTGDERADFMAIFQR